MWHRYQLRIAMGHRPGLTGGRRPVRLAALFGILAVLGCEPESSIGPAHYEPLLNELNQVICRLKANPGSAAEFKTLQQRLKILQGQLTPVKYQFIKESAAQDEFGAAYERAQTHCPDLD